MMYTKKSLGQHFLTSKQVVFALLRAADIDENDIVLEVGPGKGFITEELIKIAKKVIAVEKDGEMVGFLKNRFSKEISDGKLEVVHADILKFSFSSYQLIPNSYKLVGAIPYYITGKLFRTVLESDARPRVITFIIQKEVAERIVAKDGKESLLSLGVKAFGTPRYAQTVPRQFFSPMPKVSSAILVVENISDSMFRGSTSKHRFFRVLKAGFAHKRKILLSSLKDALGIEKETLEEAFSACEVPLKTRPEDVPLPKWGCLIEKLKM